MDKLAFIEAIKQLQPEDKRKVVHLLDAIVEDIESQSLERGGEELKQVLIADPWSYYDNLITSVINIRSAIINEEKQMNNEVI